MLDVSLPGPVLAGFADAVTWTGQGYAGVDDDELIGVLAAWQRTEAWAAAGRLSAVAELIRRRPVPRSSAPRGPGGPEDVIASDALRSPGIAGAPSDPEHPGRPASRGGPGRSQGPGSGGPGRSQGPGSGGPGRSQDPDPGGPGRSQGPGPGGHGAGGPGPDGAGPACIPAGWGKFCADELAVALACSRRAAERMLPLAHDLAMRLPLTARALREGVIDAYKAQIIAEATRVLDDAGAAAAEALAVPDIAGKTPGQIRAAIGRAVLKVDPGAARERREQAQKDARVELWREDAGTAAICGFGLPPDEALAADQSISTRALDLKAAGMPGTMDQLRVRAYLDALLGQDTRQSPEREPLTSSPAPPGAGTPAGPDVRSSGATPATPGEDDRSSGATRASPGPDHRSSGATPASPGPDHRGSRATPATCTGPAGAAAKINLTIPLATLLGLAEGPGEAAGFGPIEAALARDLAAQAAASPATSWCITITDQDGHPTAHGCAKPERRRKASRNRGPGSSGPRPPGTGPPPDGYGTWRLRPVPGGPDLTVDLEPIPVTDCDHRHQTSAHDPSDRLRHLVQIRDGECTYPPCRRAARNCDFEHAIPWEKGGRTCGCNAGARCRHHHHTKQEPGWRLEQHLPGYHTWTTPSGRQYTTGPTTYPI